MAEITDISPNFLMLLFTECIRMLSALPLNFNHWNNPYYRNLPHYLVFPEVYSITDSMKPLLIIQKKITIDSNEKLVYYNINLLQQRGEPDMRVREQSSIIIIINLLC